MTKITRVICQLVVGLGLLLIVAAPPVLWGQAANSASIVGKVTDESGAGMPNVKIKATSPALQVPQVATVTDTDGNYKLLDLPAPGVYQVTFELAGFQTLIREDVHLSVGFAGRIDASLKIGMVNQTVQVSGESPVVDPVSTTGATTLSQEQIDTVPRGRGLLDLLPLATGIGTTGKPDVGDSNLAASATIQTYGVVLDPTIELEGINITSDHQYYTSVYLDSFSLNETEVKASGNTAEVPYAGVDMTSVMKSGGNDFHGDVEGAYESPSLQANNITATLQAQGLKFTNPIKNYYDYAGDFGGRIIRDKLWFYGGLSKQSLTQGLIGFVSAPDSSGNWLGAGAPAANVITSLSQYNMKGSYQLFSTTKVTGAWEHGSKNVSASGASRLIPLPSTNVQVQPMNMWKGEIQSTLGTRFLIDAVGGYGGYIAEFHDQPGSDVAGNPASLEQSTGLHTGAFPLSYHRPNYSYQARGSVGFLPSNHFLGGSHQFKFGTFNEWRMQGTAYAGNTYGDYQLNFLNGVPTTITTYNMPVSPVNRETHQSLFGTDTWSVKGVTLNLGVRWDRFHAYYPAQTANAGPFTTGGTFPGKTVITWNTFVPRLGAAWDIHGNGKTVLKGYVGFFGDSFGPQAVGFYDPVGLITSTYKWAGPCLVTAHNNVSYNNTSCDATPATLASLTSSSPNFVSASGGSNLVVNPNLKPNITREYSARLEHLLMPNVALSVAYVYHQVSNLYFTVEPTAVTALTQGNAGSYYAMNILRTYSAWTVPVTKTDALTGDPVTVWTYPSSFAGAAFNQTTLMNTPSSRPDYYHSFEVSVTKRYSKRWNALAAFWFTKNHEWIQGLSQNPNDDRFPVDNTLNWEARGNILYNLPRGFQLSSYYRAQSGTAGQRTETFAGIPQISSATLRMGSFGQYRGPIISVLNVRIAKTFHLGETARLEPNFQVFNVLNSGAATAATYLTGATFGFATAVLSPRVARIGADFSF